MVEGMRTFVSLALSLAVMTTSFGAFAAEGPQRPAKHHHKKKPHRHEPRKPRAHGSRKHKKQ
jgi:hypothetical protein